MKFLITILMLGVLGCSHFMQRLEDTEVDSNRNRQVLELRKAEEALHNSRFEESEKAYQSFQRTFPQSVFFQSAKLGEAESLEGQGQFQEALAIHRAVYLETLRYQPDIAGHALYRSALCYEAMGDDIKAVAALLDAAKISDKLPDELAKVEIPAKLAAIYARQGREKEAIHYLDQAEQGLSELLKNRGAQLGKAWIAQIYFQMGNVSLNQLSSENYGSFAQGQMWVQSYLIKAMRLQEESWSLRAQQKLIENYKQLYRVFESEPKFALQVQMGGDLYDLMDQAELYKPITGEKIEKLEVPFFELLTSLRSKAEKILYRTQGGLTLTLESQKLNGLRRSGRLKLKSSAPLPAKIVPSDDPNL